MQVVNLRRTTEDSVTRVVIPLLIEMTVTQVANKATAGAQTDLKEATTRHRGAFSQWLILNGAAAEPVTAPARSDTGTLGR